MIICCRKKDYFARWTYLPTHPPILDIKDVMSLTFQLSFYIQLQNGVGGRYGNFNAKNKTVFIGLIFIFPDDL